MKVIKVMYVLLENTWKLVANNEVGNKDIKIYATSDRLDNHLNISGEWLAQHQEIGEEFFILLSDDNIIKLNSDKNIMILHTEKEVNKVLYDRDKVNSLQTAPFLPKDCFSLNETYIRVPSPDFEIYRDEKWFDEEAYHSYDKHLGQCYFIPVKYIKI